MKNRKQCDGCPWKVDNDPKEIPNGLKDNARSLLDRWSSGLDMSAASSVGMACHETPDDHRAQPCVGWVSHELGPGNNLALRIQCMTDKRLHGLQTVGEQRANLRDEV